MNTYLKHKPAWQQLFILGSLTVGFLVIFSIVMLFIQNSYNFGPDLTKLDYSNPRVLNIIRLIQSISSVMIFMLPAALFAYLSDSNPGTYLGIKRPLPYTFFLIALLLMMVSYPLVSWLAEINMNMHFPGRFARLEKIMRDAQATEEGLLRKVLRMRSSSDFLSMLFVLAFLPAVSEELFFRGVLQRILIQATRNPWAGIVITAIIFSAFHFQFLAFLPRTVLGIFLGAMFWQSGSLLTSILAHFVFNGIQIGIAYYAPEYMDKHFPFSAGLVVGSTVLLLVVFWWMSKISQASYAEVYDTDDDFHIGSRDQYSA